MAFNLIMVTVAIFYIVCNIVMAYQFDASEMYDEIIDGQCLVGKIFANIFYLPAWVLKGLRAVVLCLVK